MLRLPTFELHKPTTIDEALALATSLDGCRFIAGGTDLLPNLKHEMIEAQHVVALGDVNELGGIHATDEGGLCIGAMTPLAEVAASGDVRRIAPALAEAAGLVAGPQHRNQGTLGGNVMLDTRCQWINQSYFWRSALGFCLKKDGTVCHVIEKGKRCVAAVSNDTIAPLYVHGARLHFESLPTKEMLAAGAPTAKQVRLVPTDALFKADGAYNKKVGLHELLTAIELPAPAARSRSHYEKLRLRGSIDFPQLGVAARLDTDEAGTVTHADVVVIALAARPVRLKRAPELLIGQRPGADAFEAALEKLADLGSRSAKPLPNIPGDTNWRERMVPVYIKKAVRGCL
jgi:4-hydroxybenzoyl-CoA reductase subunit beta